MTQDEEPSSTDGSIATPQEIEVAISGLTQADLNRLDKICRYSLSLVRHYGGGRVTVKDLLHSAIEKALAGARLSSAKQMAPAGSRRWNKSKVDFVGFLAGIIESDVSHVLERYHRGDAHVEPILESESVRITEEGDDCNPFDCIPSDSKTPEAELIDRESEQANVDLVDKVLTMFEDDEQASEVLLYRLNELKGPEIQKRMGLSKKEYATVDQRIRRGFGRLSGVGGKHEH